jgi:adenylate cyclase, class 2
MTAPEAGATRRHDEIEVKLPCENLNDVRRKLRELGAATKAPLHFESNDLYDDENGRLAAARHVLRLRRELPLGEGPGNPRAILTFKGPVRFAGGLREREERETEVSSPDEAEAILNGLGLKRRFRYEKKREEWTLRDCTVALDEIPIGTFVEIEGEPQNIRRVVVELGLDFDRALPYSYARLYTERRKDDPSLPADMVFGRKA